MADPFSVIGKRLPRVGGADLVTGRAKFTQDVFLPGMLRSMILCSPYPHANIMSILGKVK
jgi:CO/xanthine dehydrogenase Mo-binding subunit